MRSKCFQVVRTDEPFSLGVTFGRETILDVLLIVICRKIERIRGCHILIEKRVVLNDTETLSGIIIVPLGVAIKFFVR
jgi:hypothetical protein